LSKIIAEAGCHDSAGIETNKGGYPVKIQIGCGLPRIDERDGTQPTPTRPFYLDRSRNR